ncbi:unnamed protein product [Closterium sp. Naga37s-1]|nr:unnamed protein product [Closterium sp. Naga37s-1]
MRVGTRKNPHESDRPLEPHPLPPFLPPHPCSTHSSPCTVLHTAASPPTPPVPATSPPQQQPAGQRVVLHWLTAATISTPPPPQQSQSQRGRRRGRLGRRIAGGAAGKRRCGGVLLVLLLAVVGVAGIVAAGVPATPFSRPSPPPQRLWLHTGTAAKAGDEKGPRRGKGRRREVTGTVARTAGAAGAAVAVGAGLRHCRGWRWSAPMSLLVLVVGSWRLVRRRIRWLAGWRVLRRVMHRGVTGDGVGTGGDGARRDRER